MKPPNHVISRISQDHALYQVWTFWDHSFWVMRWTNKQTDLNMLSTLTDSVGVGNNWSVENAYAGLLNSRCWGPLCDLYTEYLGLKKCIEKVIASVTVRPSDAGNYTSSCCGSRSYTVMCMADCTAWLTHCRTLSTVCVFMFIFISISANS